MRQRMGGGRGTGEKVHYMGGGRQDTKREKGRNKTDGLGMGRVAWRENVIYIIYIEREREYEYEMFLNMARRALFKG